MGLAVPLALLGLGLAALPVLAHLVRQSDVPTRTLPTVELLARALAESRRRVRIADPLLLAVRIALVVALALAATAPFVEHEVAYGNGGVASVAIVLDDSMSMSRDDRGTTLFDLARARAHAAIDALPEGSEVSVIMGGRSARVLVPRTAARDEALAAIDALAPPGARSTDLEGAVALAARQLAGASHGARRVLVLSDMIRRAGEPPLEAPSGASIDLEPLGPDTAANLAIASIDVAPDGSVEGALSVAVALRGNIAPGDVVVAIVCGERELGRATIDIEDGAARTTLRVLVPDASTFACEARIVDGHDALPADDARAFLVRSSAALRVVLVDGDPRPLSRRASATGGASTRFFAQALALAPDDGARMVARRTDVEAFVADTDTPDVIVLADADLDRADLTARVARALDAGAGLLVAGGDHVHDAGALAPRLPARLAGPVERARVGLSPGPAALRTRAEGLDRVSITRALALDADEANVALRFDDGAPALVLDRSARTAVLALPLDDSSADLPLHPGFIALSVELVRALAPVGTMPDRPVPPDALPPLSLPVGTLRAEILAPDGAARVFDQHLEAPLDLEMAASGAYAVRVVDATSERALDRAAFVIAPALEESLLDRTAVAHDDTAAPVAERSRVRNRLAPWLFALAGVLTLAEAALRRRGTR